MVYHHPHNACLKELIIMKGLNNIPTSKLDLGVISENGNLCSLLWNTIAIEDSGLPKEGQCSESRFSEKRWFGLKEVPSVYSRWCSYHRKEASSTLKAKARSFLVNAVNEFGLQITESCSALNLRGQTREKKSSCLTIVCFNLKYFQVLKSFASQNE